MMTSTIIYVIVETDMFMDIFSTIDRDSFDIVNKNISIQAAFYRY